MHLKGAKGRYNPRMQRVVHPIQTMWGVSHLQANGMVERVKQNTLPCDIDHMWRRWKPMGKKHMGVHNEHKSQQRNRTPAPTNSCTEDLPPLPIYTDIMGYVNDFNA